VTANTVQSLFPLWFQRENMANSRNHNTALRGANIFLYRKINCYVIPLYDLPHSNKKASEIGHNLCGNMSLKVVFLQELGNNRYNKLFRMSGPICSMKC
jgi:hypothetical protein